MGAVSRNAEFVVVADDEGNLHTSQRPVSEQLEVVAARKKIAFQKALVEREFRQQMGDVLRRKAEIRAQRETALSVFA
jgi:hypothetical protein